MITSQDKLQCIIRELGYRQHVYARRVAEGRMSEKQARHEIEVMQEIAADYRTLVKKEELPLDGAA
jgi:hypothetical protein